MFTKVLQTENAKTPMVVADESMESERELGPQFNVKEVPKVEAFEK